MNTFQLNARDRAISEAKRADSDTVAEIHVAAALAGILQHPMLHTLRNEARSNTRRNSSAVSISIHAQGLLERCETRESAREVFEEFVKGRVGADDSQHSGAPETGSVSETASRELGSSDLSIQEVLDELNSLVGLSSVKTQVQKFLAVHQANQVRQEQGLTKVPLSLHLVFTGQPGTGKTTVARIIGKLYQASGLLPIGHLVETDRSGLVAGFIGQTALKVQEVMDQADGGILFIDEAYALASDSNEDYGREAVSALVKGMEDKRDTLAVIAAGYQNEMSRFINLNPGLKSRFQTFIDFPSYSASEMAEIFNRLGATHGIDVSRVDSLVLAHFESIRSDAEAGNGRHVRILFEQMYANLALRAMSDGAIDVKEITTFEPIDVPRVEPKSDSLGAGYL